MTEKKKANASRKPFRFHRPCPKGMTSILCLSLIVTEEKISLLSHTVMSNADNNMLSSVTDCRVFWPRRINSNEM